MATKSTTQKKSVPVQEVARRLLDANYAKVEDMKKAGWTDSELESLKAAPRTRAAACDDPNGAFTWPLVDGHRLLYSFFTREEKDLYNPWYKAHHQGTTSGGTSAKMTPEQKKLWDELLAATSKNARAHELVIALMPKPKNGPLQKLFGIDDISQLNTKVTLDWILYRGKDECRGSNGETFTIADGIKEFGADLHPAMTKAEVLKLVNDLEAKGTKVRASIIGL